MSYFIDDQGKRYPIYRKNNRQLVFDLRDRTYFLKNVLSPPSVSVSEYISTIVFRSLGIPVQDTLLGFFETETSLQRVAACQELEQDGFSLRYFRDISQDIFKKVRGGFGLELDEILQTIRLQTLVEPDLLLRFFWEMFVVDALIGNYNRNNCEWGILYRRNPHSIRISPVFSSSSCLYPHADEKKRKSILHNRAEMDYRLYHAPQSVIMQQDKKINYYNFLTTCHDPDFCAAFLHITRVCHMSVIYSEIKKHLLISQEEKEFYLFVLQERYEKIIMEAAHSCFMTEAKEVIT